MPRRPDPAHVLVVDDEPEVCQLIADALRFAGLDVAGATTEVEALHAAGSHRPDLIVADIWLDDCSGLDLVDRLREELGDIPAVFITGRGDAATFSEASRRQPVELMNKPIDLGRLRRTVENALRRQEVIRRRQQRNRRVRELARHISRQRRAPGRRLPSSGCADLAETCRRLQRRLHHQEILIHHQKDLLTARDEDDIFRRFFRLFVERSGPVFGVTLLCDANAELQMAGRFGVPRPDGVNFSHMLAMATVPGVLERPTTAVIDAYEHMDMFPEPLHKFLVGVTVLAVPLMVSAGQLIGVVVLYRKGEQPFTDEDVTLAEIIAPSTAAAVQRTE